MNSNWYKAKIIEGKKRGRIIGFPTVNLESSSFQFSTGVYTTKVSIGKKIHLGVLFFGPRLSFNEKDNVLEIHLIDFSGKVKGNSISFQILDYIREVRQFSNTQTLIKQINQDLKSAKKIFQKLSKPS